MTWKTVRLDECCSVVAGATPATGVKAYWDGDICWATPKDLSDLNGPYIGDTPRKITSAGLGSCAATILPIGSVLFSSRAPIGHVAINTVPMATNQGFKSLVPIEGKADAKYLYHWLRANRAYLESLGNGATFKEVSKAIVSRVDVPLPSIAEQCRIAAILDQAATLQTQRRAAIVQLDKLGQAIFLEMFGDPRINPNRWPCAPLVELGRVITGNTPSRANPDYFGSAIEWVKSDNINTPSYFLTQAEEGLSELGRAVARTVPADSILVTCIAGSAACIGNAAMTNREVAFNQQINGFVPKRTNPHYAYMHLVVGKELIQMASTNGMKGMVSKSRFEQVTLMQPPVDLQALFAERIQSVERLKAAHRTALSGLDELFASLQHRAFRGELTPPARAPSLEDLRMLNATEN